MQTKMKEMLRHAIRSSLFFRLFSKQLNKANENTPELHTSRRFVDLSIAR